MSIYNIPGDYHTYFGGHFSRELQGRQGNNSRNICVECKDINRKKDPRTRINCSKCGSAVFKAHSNIVCKNCL